jgi:hypothetical protein
MMWYADKAAFGAGYVSNLSWDIASVDKYSVAMGYNTTAAGKFSFAAGIETVASGFS